MTAANILIFSQLRKYSGSFLSFQAQKKGIIPKKRVPKTGIIPSENVSKRGIIPSEDVSKTGIIPLKQGVKTGIIPKNIIKKSVVANRAITLFYFIINIKHYNI